MAVTPGSILQLKVFQNLQGQQVLNVQYYRILTLTASTTSLTGFSEPAAVQWFDKVKAFQSALVTYVRAELLEVNGVETDGYTYVQPAIGARSGQVVSPFAAFGVRQIRRNRLTRNGQKRFAGVSEDDIANGVITGAIQAVITANCEDLFRFDQFWQDPEDSGRSMAVQPIIWGGNSPQYPDGRFSDITGVLTNVNITTQNTRKIRAREGV